MKILVGDADGIDSLVQNYCSSLNYYNLVVYSISTIPRYQASSKFDTKYIETSQSIRRKRFQEKDKAMTIDSEFTFSIWDSKSQGSYANILRGLDNDKKIKLYLYNKKIFLDKIKITKNDIEFMYRESNGYTASEVVMYLKSEVFTKAQDLYKYLIKKLVIEKFNKIYIPASEYENLFIIDKYQGKIKGIKFKNEFINWIKKNIKQTQKHQHASLF